VQSVFHMWITFRKNQCFDHFWHLVKNAHCVRATLCICAVWCTTYKMEAADIKCHKNALDSARLTSVFNYTYIETFNPSSLSQMFHLFVCLFVCSLSTSWLWRSYSQHKHLVQGTFDGQFNFAARSEHCTLCYCCLSWAFYFDVSTYVSGLFRTMPDNVTAQCVLFERAWLCALDYVSQTENLSIFSLSLFLSHTLDIINCINFYFFPLPSIILLCTRA
jgi:hypothetical protein